MNVISPSVIGASPSHIMTTDWNLWNWVNSPTIPDPVDHVNCRASSKKKHLLSPMAAPRPHTACRTCESRNGTIRWNKAARTELYCGRNEDDGGKPFFPCQLVHSPTLLGLVAGAVYNSAFSNVPSKKSLNTGAKDHSHNGHSVPYCSRHVP